nr:transposase [uncultured Acetatifactor sp.]
MNDREYFLTTSLSYQLQAARRELAGFRSGEAWQKMRADYEGIIREKDLAIKKLQKERDEFSFSRRKITKQWLDVLEDVRKEYEKETARLKKVIAELQDMVARLKNRNSELDEKRKKALSDYYDVAVKLEEAQGLIMKLTAQVNHNYENSSLPSSKCIGRKKIVNNREKTGKKPGGQAGHPHHPRRPMEPDRVVEIAAEERFRDGSRYVPTGNMVSRQAIGISIVPVVTEYRTAEFYDKKKGRNVHSAFPCGVTDDVNYDGSMKAVLFLLNSRCNVSLEKTAQFVRDVTDGAVSPSVGMINGLCREFSSKSRQEQDRLFVALLDAPVMHVDGTAARVNGNNNNVVVCSNGAATMYFARENKGHAGIRDTPVEAFGGILIHDHEACFYSYGSDHQECMVHIERYLRDSIENEKGLTWNGQMLALIQEMIHENKTAPTEGIAQEKIAGFEARYDSIVQTAAKEYADAPPTDYYRDGYNLYLRMVEYKHNHLLFLSNPLVEPDNNLCERKARVLKGKINQAISLRSFRHLEYFCECLSVIDHLATDETNNLYQCIKEIFKRPKPGKPKPENRELSNTALPA